MGVHHLKGWRADGGDRHHSVRGGLGQQRCCHDRYVAPIRNAALSPWPPQRSSTGRSELPQSADRNRFGVVAINLEVLPFQTNSQPTHHRDVIRDGCHVANTSTY